MPAQDQNPQTPATPINTGDNLNDTRGLRRRSSSFFMFGTLAGLLLAVIVYQFIIPSFNNPVIQHADINVGNDSSNTSIAKVIHDTIRIPTETVPANTEAVTMLSKKVDSLTMHTTILMDSINRMHFTIQQMQVTNRNNIARERIRLIDSIHLVAPQ